MKTAKRHKAGYLFLAPAVVAFTVFTLTPIVMVARLSLFKTNYIFSEWIGIRHYVEAFSDPAFLRSILNSLLYAAFLVPMGTLGPLLVALSVFNSSSRTQDFMRFAFYIPSLATAIVMAGIYRWIFAYRGGLVNYLLSLLGIKSVMWFGIPGAAIGAISGMVALGWMGGHLLMFMAVLRTVPQEMTDTARVDGASWFQIKLRILVPLISPWICFQALLSMIAAFQVWIYIWRLTGGGPANRTSTMLFHIYQTAFVSSRYGKGSAQSMIMLVILLVLAIIKRRLEGEEEGYI